MLWHDVLDGWQKLRAKGEPPFPALQQAIDSVFDARIGDISGRGKLAADMREIWMMQPRFERRVRAAQPAAATGSDAGGDAQLATDSGAEPDPAKKRRRRRRRPGSRGSEGEVASANLDVDATQG